MENKNKGIIFAAVAVVAVVVLMFVFFGGGGNFNPENKRIIAEIDKLNDQMAMKNAEIHEILNKKHTDESFKQAWGQFNELKRQKTELVPSLASVYTEEECDKVWDDLNEICFAMQKAFSDRRVPRSEIGAVQPGLLKDAFTNAPTFKECIEEYLGRKLKDTADPWGEPYRIGGVLIEGGKFAVNPDGPKYWMAAYSVDKYSKKGYIRCDPYRTVKCHDVVLDCFPCIPRKP